MKKARKFLLVLLIALTVWTASAPLLSRWLVVEVPMERADAIFVLSGSSVFQQRIEKAAEEGTPVEGTVIEVVKGGLILDLGVRGFLPASLVDIRRVADLEEFLGQTLECRVIELNRFRNNVVLSRRAVLEEEI